jgi:CRISPR/Cas system-associated endonuclease Cas1
MQLVINTPGTFITQKDECFRLKQKEKVLDISPAKVESIVLSNQAMVSTQAVVLALENNIDIIFPFYQEDFKNIKVLGQGSDKKLINEEILSRFFNV